MTPTPSVLYAAEVVNRARHALYALRDDDLPRAIELFAQAREWFVRADFQLLLDKRKRAITSAVIARVEAALMRAVLS
jgi:hypothetical protein